MFKKFKDFYNKFANYFGIKLKVFDTLFSNKQLLIVEGILIYFLIKIINILF